MDRKTALTVPALPRQAIVLGLLAVPLVLVGLMPVPGLVSVTLLAAAGAILLLAVYAVAADQRARPAEGLAAQDLSRMIGDDPSPCLATAADGVVVAQNAAARARFGDRVGQPVVKALSGLLVNAPAVVFRQETGMAETGSARETVFTRNGHVRLTTHRVGDGALWRIDEGVAVATRQGDGIALPMLLASQNGTVLSMNDAMRNLLGQRARSLAAIFGDRQVMSGARMELAGADGPVEATVIEAATGDGRREIYAIPGPDIGPSLSLPAGMLDVLPVPTLLARADGRILSCNAAARALLGVPEGQTELTLDKVVEGPGRLVRDWMQDILEDRLPNRPEVVRALLRADECSVKITLGRVQDDGEARVLAVLQDATDLQSLQQQFAQSQKMQAIGELAGGVAHDFNNLLTAITGHCDLLLLRHDQGDLDYADLVQIHQNANRAASLVGQLLAFSRKQTMKPELIDLRDTMADLTHLLNRLVGERVTLHLSQDPALQPIRADRRLLDQVLMNLVVNARDAMPEGGPIRIVTRMERLDAPMQRGDAVVPTGTYAVIEVSDEGVGIPEDRIVRIFEPFYTTKTVGEGTGLGLSMAYGIVKQSGGYIFADSVVGAGSTFRLYFPAHDWPSETPAPKAPSRAGAAAMPRESTGVVLLVEDEAPVRAFASRALKLKGFSVVEAESGDHALEILDDEGLEVDVFVTDMIMPGRDGPTWVREALRSRPDVGIVFMSGYAEDAYGKFPDIPQAVFLAKPFSLADLSDTVRRQVP
ncbi:response regulator [Rhodobacterales bacterium HKCCE2091]|nr:response regulator [Rhodobacterales bacterium HKCCE2091]